MNINKDAESDPGVKVAAAAWFKRMEDGDEDASRIGACGVSCLKKYTEEYDRLNVYFDMYTGESKVREEVAELCVREIRRDGVDRRRRRRETR